MKVNCIRFLWVFSSLLLLVASSTEAANGVWNGSQSAYWTNSANWSAAPYPSGVGETASFTNAGNDQTTIDLSGLFYIRNIRFEAPLVAAYTIGAGAAGSQTLVLADSGEIALSSTAGNSQTINCGLQLGGDRTAQSYVIRNDNPAQTLTFADLFGCPIEASGNPGLKTLTVLGSGPTTFNGLRPVGASGIVLSTFNTSTITLAGSNTLYQVVFNGGSGNTLDIGNKELYLNGGNPIYCNQDTLITGSGALRLNTTDTALNGGYNYADLYVALGRTLTVNANITGLGGIEIWSGTGNFIFNGTNTFLGHICFGSSSSLFVSKIGNRGSLTSNLGAGTNLYFGSNGRLVYTGAGESSDRVVVLNSDGRIDQSGPSGKLTFTATPTLLNAGRTLTLQGSTAGIGEFSAPLVNTGANALSLTKAGSGTWILSGTNLYTGATTLNGGKLLVNAPGCLLGAGSAVTVNHGTVLGGNSTLNGSVTVNAGGLLAPGDVSTAGTLSLNSTLNLTAATLLFDLVAPDSECSVTDKVSVASLATVNGVNTIALNFPNGSAPAGSYTLMTFPARAGTGTFVLSPAYPNVSLYTNATLVRIDVAPGGATQLLWKGDVSGNWDGSDQNWRTNGVALSFTPGASVAFDDAAAQFTVSSTAPVSPGSVVFNNSLSNYTVAAAITGTGAVYKLGSGEVTLTGSSAFTNTLTIASGLLRIGTGGLLGAGNFGTNIVNNGELVYASSVAQTNSGLLSGSGNLTVCGTAPLTLSGTNTYSGLTLVTNGTLRIGSASALGATSLGTVVASNGVLELSAMPTGITLANETFELRGKLSCKSPGTTTVGGVISLFNNAVLDVGAGSTLFVSATTPNLGSNTVTKTGNGTLRFTADPDHRSVFVIAEGTVELAHGGSTDAPWLISPGATLRDITSGALGDYFVQANGTLDLRVNETIGGLSGIGLVTNSGASAITLTVGGNNQSGDFSGTIRNGAGTASNSVTKTGTGVQTLSGANTYSGPTTLSGGTLNLNSASAIGTGTFIISGNGYSLDNTSGASLTLANNNTLGLNGDFTFIGSKSLHLGSGPASINGNRTVNVLTNTLSLGGVISGGYALTKNGAGMLALSGANTYSGATTVNGGALLVNSPGSLASGSAVTVNSGAILGGNGTINGTVTAATNSLLAPGGLNAVGTLTLASASSTALTLSGALITFDLATVADVGVCDQIALTGAGSKVVLNGTTRIALNLPTNGVPAGTYTLISSQAGFTTNVGASVALLTAYPNTTLTNGVNSIVLLVSGDGIPGALWTGSTSGNWDGSDQNWLTNGVASIYPSGAAATFDDTASGNFTVSSSGLVSPASLLLNNSANDYSLAVQLGGTGPLTKQGSAAVTLTGMTAYSPAAIALNDGSLTFGGASQLNSGDFAGDIFNNGTLTYASSANQIYSGMISGYGALTKAGNGLLTLSGSNLYSGVTLVDSGTLKVQHAYGLGSTTAGTTVNPAGTLELAGGIYTLPETLLLNGTLSSQSGSNTFAGTLTLTSGSRIDVGTGSTLVLTNTVGSSCLLANGPFVKTGGGRLVLQKDPNGNGLMTVREGSVDVANTMDANAVINSGAKLFAVGGAFNDNSSRVQVDAGGTYVIRGDDTLGGLAGAGLVTKDTSGTATLTIGNNNVPETFSGTITNGSGVIALTKNGTGVQILSGKNTYTGATTVQFSGALYILSPGSLGNTAVTVNNTGTILGGDGSILGAVTMTGNTILSPGVSNTVGTLTLGSTLALTSCTLMADIPAAPADAADRVAVAGALTLSGANLVSLSFPAGAAAAGDYTLLNFASKSGTGSFQLAGAYPNASLVLSSTNLLLRVSGSGTSSLTWNGNVSGSWDGSDANWLLGSTPATFADGSAVAFTDTASSFNVTSLGDVTPSALVFNNAGSVYSVAANIKGTAPLNKFGLAATYLSGISSYNPSSITIANGWVYLSQNAQLNGGAYGSNLIVNAGGFGYASAMPQILTGVISGSGGLSKSGLGTLTLANANSFGGTITLSGGTLYAAGYRTAMGTGNMTLSGGTLELDHDAGLVFTNNVTSYTANTTVKSGRLTYGPGVTNTLGTLAIGNNTLYAAPGLNVIPGTPYGLTFGATTISGSTPTFDVANNGTGIGHLTLATLSGNNHLNKTGAGTLFLGWPSLRSGGTNTVSAGTLKLGSPTSLGTNGLSLAINLNGGTLDLASDVTVTNYPTRVGGATTILSNKATPASAGITHTLGALTLANNLSVAAGANVGAGTPFGITFGTTTLGSTPTLDVAANGTLTLGSTSGSFGLTKTGNGTLVLASPNAYTGMTTVTKGLLILTGSNGSISNTSAITLSGNSTLELRNSTASNWTDRVRNGIPITLAGATLNFSHTGGTTGYGETLGALSLTANSNLFVTSQANVGYTSVVTLASLARSGGAIINFAGAGLGDSDRNRIFITGQAEGNLGPWAMVNGTNFAFYSVTRGICATTNTYDLAARGPGSVVPNDSNLVARINSPGISGPITLAGDLTNRIFGVRQNTGTDAVISTLNGTANKLLLTHGLFITDGQGSLTLGEKVGDGLLAPLVAAEGLLLDVDGASGVLTLNTPIAEVGGAVVVKKYGSGKVALSSMSSYSGVTTVYEGTLLIQSTNALGTTAGNTVVNTGAVLEVAGNIAPGAEPVSLFGTLSNPSGINIFGGVITTLPGAAIDVGETSLLIVSGSTTGSGGFTKTGAGTLRLTADPNQTGLYTVNAGTLELNHPGTTDAAISIAPGATLRELTPNDLKDDASVTNNGTFDIRGSDTMGMLVGSGLVTVGTGVTPTLTIGNESSKIATFSGVIENGWGVLSLSKSGSSTQILTGTNTYTGPTVLNERSGLFLVNAPGTLQATASVTVNNGATLGGTGSILSSVTVLAGGGLLPADAGVIGTLTLGGSLTLNGATLYVDAPATLSASDLISVAGVLTVNGVNTIALSFPGGLAPAGDYTLMNFASRTGTGSFTLLGIGSTLNATLELTATSLILHVSEGSALGLTWNGNLSPVWDGGILNWKSNGAAASFADGMLVSFDDTAYGNLTVSSVGYSVNPSALHINSNTNNYTINAVLAGTAPIVKSGWSSAYLNNALNYNPASITVNPVGTLFIGTAANAQLNNGVYANPIFLNGGTFRFESGAALTINSLITGGGSLVKYGTGTLTLNAANTFRGSTTHGAGQLNINNGGTDNTASAIGLNRLYIGGGAIFDNTSGSDITIMTANPMDWNGDFIYAGSSNSLNFGTGSVNINSASRTITVRQNMLTIGGNIGQNGGTYGLTKAGNGTLVLAGSSSYNGGTTLSGGTLCAQKNGAALGTGGLTLNTAGTTLEYDNDTALTFNNAATVSASMTLKSGRLTVGPGVVHTLGTLSINASTLSVAPGTNVLANTPYGLTYGTTTLTAGPAVLNVANNGGAAGTLTLGAVGGNFALTKKGNGVLRLPSVSLLSGPTAVNNGRLLAVTGGSCSNSAVTIQAADLADAAASLSVLYSAASTQWTCSNLITAVSAAPASSRPALEFSFAALPSTTVAPLRVRDTVTFATNPVVNVYLGNLTVPTNSYPLMVVGVSAPTTVVPTLNMVGGYTNSFLYWNGNTLMLRLYGSGMPLKWTPGATSSGTWDVNNSANLVWTNGAAMTYYQEPLATGSTGDSVLFNDSTLTGPSTVTLAGSPSPSSILMTNALYTYTFTGSGSIAGTGSFSKFGTNLLTLATANTYTGATTFAAGLVNIPSGAGINVANVANAGMLSVGTLAGTTVVNIAGGTVNVTKSSIPALQVGTTNSVIGVINLSAGTLYTGSELWLGSGGNGGQNGFGALNVTGGSVTSASYLAIGRALTATGNNRGELLVSAGAVTVNANNIEIGSYQNGVANTCVATLSGGTTTLASGAGDLIVGNNQNGILNVSGSAVVSVLNTGKALKVGNASGVTGIANLNGGLVTVPAVTQAAGAFGYLNFNGGTLKANKNNTSFLSGLTAARIYAGGVTLDDGGYAITVAQSLLSPCTGNGVSLDGLSFSGKGFVAPPIVDIAGFGNGASAVATIDANGILTGVTLTSPGANYHMGTPTLTFTGGGGTVTQTGSASTAPNTSGGLTKVGAGTLTMTGTNTYSGATVVNGGRLVLATGASCSNSAVTVQAVGAGTNALFGVRYAGSDTQAAIAGLTTGSGIGGGGAPDLEFAFAAVPSASTAPLAVTGEAVFSVTPGVRVILTGLTVANGAYPLMTVGGTAPTAVPALTVAGGYSGSTLSWSGNTLMLNLAGSAAALKWGTGAAGSGAWNVNDSANLVWKDGASAPAYYQETLGAVGNQVVFDDTFVTLNNTVTLSTTVTPSGVAADNATFVYTLSGSGAIAGTNALVKSGAATFRLANANTYSGGTLINVGGVLQVSHANGLGTGGITNNGTLNLDAGAGGTGDINYTGLNNSLSGAGTNNVSLGTGSQRMYLTGNYSGFVGVWNIGVGAFAGASRAEMTGLDNAAATVNVLTNGTLWVSAAGTHVATANLYGGDTGESYGQLRVDTGVWAGPVVLAGPITGAGDGFFGAQTANSEIAGTISEVNGPYIVSKVGAFTSTFSGANTYLGPTAVMAGGLRVPALGSVSGGPSPLGAPTTPAQGTVKLGFGGTTSTLIYSGMGETSDRIIDLAGTTGGAVIDHSGTNLLKLTGGLTYSGSGAKTLTLQGSTIGTGEFAGVISNTPFGNAITVVKAGAGTWTLSSANTYTGGTQIKGGGTLVAAHPNALGTNTVLFPNEVGGLDFAHDGVGETVNEFFAQSGATATLKSNRSAPGEGINHNIGLTHLSGVTLYVTNGENVVSGKATITADYLDLYAGSAQTTVLAPTTADLLIKGGVSILGSAYDKTLKLDGTSLGSAILGPITNGLGKVVSLTKANASTWTLYGSNTFSGATAISGGAIVLAGTNGAFAGTSGITLSGNAVLELSNSELTNSTDRLRDAAGITLSGGTLRFAHAGGAADYSERLGAIAVTAASNTFATSLADFGRTSVVTVASLSNTGIATLDFVGEGLGASDRNRIFITGQTPGPIGAWATINGTNLAAYSSALGVYVFGSSVSDVVTNLAARGNVPNSVVPDNASALAQITEPGDNGPITLEGSWTNRLFLLTQNNPTGAVVETVSYTTNKTLLVTALAIAAGQGDLKIGVEPGNGYVAPLTPGGNLKLENSSASSVLTLNAAVVNNSTASTISKFGTGTAVLAGSNTFSGAVTVNEGTLEFGGPFGQRLSNVIGGAGAVAKSGTNQLHILSANTYTGPTYIKQGVVRANDNATFGTTNSPVIITDGGTLNVGCTPDVGGTRALNSISFGNKLLVVSGAGYLGQGAINNTSTAMQYNAFSRISLAGDTTLGANQRWDMNNNVPASLDLNDYTLTKTGTADIAIHNVQVNPGTAGKVVLNQGLFRFETGSSVNGTSNNTVTVNRGATFDLWQLTANSPSLWSVILNEGAFFNGSGGINVTNLNVWNGPVTLNGRAFISSGYAPSHLTLNGDISGAGSIVKQGGATVTLWLHGTNNTYSGGTIVSNGTLFARHPGSLPGYDAGKVTVAPAATLALMSGDGTVGWNADQIKSLHDTSTFVNNTAVLSIDTTPASVDYASNLTNALALTKRGNNTLTLNGTNTFTGAVAVNGGTLTFAPTSTNVVGPIVVSGGSTNTTLNIGGVTTIGTGTTHTVSLTAASGDRSIATLSANATFGKMFIGGTSGASGAFVQNSGELAVGPTTYSTDVLDVGNGGGYGYYRMNGGKMTTGQLGLVGGGGGTGVFDLYDGSVTVQGVPSLGGWLIWGWSANTSIGVLNMFGGSLKSPAANETTLAYAGNGSTLGALNLLGPGALLDTTTGGRSINMARTAGNFLSSINLNSGTILANKVYAAVTGTPTVFGFNGGTLRAASSSPTFMQGLTAGLVYPGGAVIDSSNATITVGQSLLAPTGYGVTYIPVLTGGTNYIGAPAVKITGGGGIGATAIATVDLAEGSPTKGQVTGITVTSAGTGYQWFDTPVATLVGGGATTPATVGLCYLAPNTSAGGLTKMGSGTLTLAGTNTFGGTTLINSGTLRLGLANALPTDADVMVNGGTYDLGGFYGKVITNGSITLVSGSVTNGTFNASLTKTGAGSATLAAGQENAQPIVVSEGTLRLAATTGSQVAGLYEGPLAGNGNTTDGLSSNVLVQLGTRMANTNVLPPWSDNVTYLYSGYIWNRTGTNATWTFGESIDDNTLLKIDGTTVINDGNWGSPTIGTITLTPGPHVFEVRFGNGSGGAGLVPNRMWWATNSWGFGIDFQGHTATNAPNFFANFVPCTDPGDGSLLTRLPYFTGSNVLNTNSVVEIDAGATLDLGGSTQIVAQVSGSGTVSNGTLAVTGMIAPGGTNNIGVLTVVSSSITSGTLLVDVDKTGTSSSDCLAVKGDIDLSGLSLQIANPGQLNKKRAYTILTCTGGTRTGTLLATNLPDPHWHLVYLNNGTVQLIYMNGTLLRVR